MIGSGVPRGPRRGWQSRAGDAALSPGHNQADETPAGLGPAPDATPADGDRPGQDAGFAVAALGRAHYPSLARIAALLAGVAVAEQVVQDAFASAQRELRRGQYGDEVPGLPAPGRSHRGARPARGAS